MATYNMVRGFVEAGNRVDLLAMNTSKHHCRTGETGIPGINRVRHVFIDNYISYPSLVYNMLFSSLPYTASRFNSHEYRSAIESMLREEDYDIVQVEGLYLCPYITVIRENSGARIVYRAHNIESAVWKSYHRRTGSVFRKMYLNNLIKKLESFELGVINNYDLLVPVTDADLHAFSLMGNSKPAMAAPFGMYPDEFTAESNKKFNGYTLQYIGALDWLPNIEAIEWFIDNIWAKIKKRHPDIRFRIAGRGAKSSFARKLFEHGIDFSGEVESSKKFLSEGGLFISPLFSGSGIRVKIIEAFFMRIPVIATSFSASGIPAEDGLNILLADSESEFLNGIDKLLSDENYAAELANNGWRLAMHHFNNKSIIQRLMDFYKRHSV